MQHFSKYLKLLLPGLLPLVLFVVADEFISTFAALVVALSSGAIIFAFTWIRFGKPDTFILVDTLILAAFGGVSLLLHDELFFKLKPGVIQSILVLILGVSAYSSKNIMLSMAKRYMPDSELKQEQISAIQQQLKVLFWLFALHTILVFYSAVYMSHGAWVFISGVFFYILAGAYFLIVFLKTRFFAKKMDWLPILSDDGRIVGKATREQCHNGSKLLHPVVHLHLFDNKGRLYLQKRAHHKQVQPGMWDSSVGGHVGFGEKPEIALLRETYEEIEIVAKGATLIFTYVWESEMEKELVYVYALNSDQIPKPNPDELEGGEFMSLAEIKKNLGKQKFTPNFEKEFELLIKKIRFN